MSELPQDMQEFIAKHSYQDGHEKFSCRCVSVEALVYWMSGHARVPVELIESLRSHVVEGNVIRFGLRDTKASRRALADLLSASKGEQ